MCIIIKYFKLWRNLFCLFFPNWSIFFYKSLAWNIQSVDWKKTECHCPVNVSPFFWHPQRKWIGLPRMKENRWFKVPKLMLFTWNVVQHHMILLIISITFQLLNINCNRQVLNCVEYLLTLFIYYNIMKSWMNNL